MIRKLATCLLFGALGAASAYGARLMMTARMPQQSPQHSTSVAESARRSGFDAAAVVADPGGSSFVGTTLAIYSDAGELSDVAELQARVADLVKRPGALARDSERMALLLRLVEIDPRSAVQFAMGLSVDARFIAAMFQVWAAGDFESALDELHRVPDRRLVRTVALELVPVVGRDRDGIERLATLFGDLDHDGFVADALVRLAETDPEVALEIAIALTDHWARESTVEQIAQEWVKQDVYAALQAITQLEKVQPRLRHSIQFAALDEWVAIDPDAALKYLTGPDGRSMFSLGYGGLDDIVARLAIRRPEELLSAASGFSGIARSEVVDAALRSMAENDVGGAIERARLMPPGGDRSRFLEIIALVYAREDFRGALAWAGSLTDQTPRLMRDLLSEAARTDLTLAIEAALESKVHASSIESWLQRDGALANMDAAEIRRIGDRLVEVGASQSDAVAELIRTWSSADPAAAIGWLLDSTSQIDRSQLRSAALAFARGNLGVAIEAIDDLPSDLRGTWLGEVAAAFTQENPDAAVTWLAQFAAEPGYDAWISAAAERSASPFSSDDPSRVARLLGTAQRPDASITQRVVARWAESDPRSAAEWAFGLKYAAAQSDAVVAAARVWTARDQSAAGRWVLSLPPGELRDRALTVVVLGSIEAGDPVDARLLRAFSSENARAQIESQLDRRAEGAVPR